MKQLIITILLVASLLPSTTWAQGQPDGSLTVIDLSMSDVSNDIKLALAGVLQRLRGIDEPIDGVEFAVGGRHMVGENGFDYEGFEATGIAITGYTSTMLDSSQASVILEGVILFKDMLSRRAGTYFCLQYLASQNGISIQKSVATGLPPDFPRVETFLISEDNLRAGMANLKSFADYYLHVLEYAEPMVYGPGGDSTGKNGKYFIISFCKDRLFEESDLKMTIKDKSRQRGKDLAKPIYLNDSGWRFMIAGRKIRPGSRSSKFYGTVTYQQDPKSYLPATVVAEFENEKTEVEEMPQPVLAQPASAPAPQATPQPVPTPVPVPRPQATPVPVPQPTPVPVPQPMPQAAPAPTPQAAPATTIDGPLANGSAFLNPIFPEDVTLIQERLKTLGYYNGPIDMEFGPLTKKGLDRFAVRNGFPAGQWSINLQKILFKGTGL